MSEKLSMPEQIIEFLRELIRDPGHDHFIWSRVIVASWGSAVFHFALLFNKQGNLSPVLDKILRVIGYPEMSVIIIMYSLTFGCIVAASKPKSSLVRHFVYGALLPAVAYAFAARY